MRCLLYLSIIIVIIFLAVGMWFGVLLHSLSTTPLISLNAQALPYYAGCTVLRMWLALIGSLVFSVSVATWSAKSARAERVIIPLMDVAQSIPVLGFLSLVVLGFHVHNNRLAFECIAIFAIFTAQAWNLFFDVHHSLKSIPCEWSEMMDTVQCSAWQKFWKMEFPFAIPSLIWNVMLSLSNSWIFLVAAESFSFGPQHINLPGIGSYIALAIANKNTAAIFYSIIAMICIICATHYFIFKPLLIWSTKFKIEDEETKSSYPFFIQFIQKTFLFTFINHIFSLFKEFWINCFKKKTRKKISFHMIGLMCYGALILMCIFIGYRIVRISIDYSFHEMIQLFYFGCLTALRVIFTLIVSSIIWVPIGMYIGLHARAMRIVQPIVQCMAAFPMNLIFPFVVGLILRHHLNTHFFLSVLMVLSAQWYMLFNVMIGASRLSVPLQEMVQVFQVRRITWWLRFALPGIAPYYITGALTLSGAAWNVSMIAECVQWGNTQLYATGLGSYITQSAQNGDYVKVFFGTCVMLCFVLLFNYCVWQPLYKIYTRR